MNHKTNFLSSTWATFKKHWRPLVTLTAIPLIINYAAVFVSMSSSPGLRILGGILNIVAGLMFIPLYVSLIRLAQHTDTNPTAVIDPAESYRKGFDLFWPVIGLGIVQGLVMMGSMVLFIIPGIVMNIFLSFSMIILVLERKKIFEAFNESYSLVRGRWWQVLGWIVILLVTFVVIGFIGAGLVKVIAVLCGLATRSAGGFFTDLLVRYAINAFFVPFSMIYLYKLYTYLKQTKTAQVVTSTFKNWIITFIVIGALAIISAPIIAILVLLTLRR